jgi:hypothetical protein
VATGATSTVMYRKFDPAAYWVRSWEMTNHRQYWSCQPSGMTTSRQRVSIRVAGCCKRRIPRHTWYILRETRSSGSADTSELVKAIPRVYAKQLMTAHQGQTTRISKTWYLYSTWDNIHWDSSSRRFGCTGNWSSRDTRHAA